MAETTFALPDLRGRVAVSSGQGPGLSTYDVGETGGTESVSLAESQMPTHNHAMSVNGPSSTSNSPTNRYLGRISTGKTYAGTTAARLWTRAIAPSGGGQPHETGRPTSR